MQNDIIQDAAYDLIFLDPRCVTLFRTGGSAVRATIDDPQIGGARTYLVTQIARAFPLSKLNQYFGLRDGKDRDIGMLLTLDGLTEDSKKIIDEELERRYFLPQITKVTKLKKEFDTVNWEVETDKGKREFTMQNLKDSVHDVGGGRILLTDRNGNRYEIPNLPLSDEKTIAMLSRVL
jgi:hypothetical protein